VSVALATVARHLTSGLHVYCFIADHIPKALFALFAKVGRTLIAASRRIVRALHGWRVHAVAASRRTVHAVHGWRVHAVASERIHWRASMVISIASMVIFIVSIVSMVISIVSMVIFIVSIVSMVISIVSIVSTRPLRSTSDLCNELLLHHLNTQQLNIVSVTL
jgi:hypothetical protein